MQASVAHHKLLFSTKKNIIIWLAGVSFTLFQFFLQLSSGVILSSMMYELHLNPFWIGILGSAFYYIYTSMQIPAGYLYDHGSPRKLLFFSAMICSIGCISFAYSTQFITLLLSRLCIGGGSSFAFVGLAHLLRIHFPLRYFGLLLGLSETLAFLATAIGIASISSILHLWGWRHFMLLTGYIGFIIACFILWAIPKVPAISLSAQRFHIISILKNKTIWLNGLFVSSGFITITVYGAMWLVPYLQIKLGYNISQAAHLNAWLFIGAALSCPVAGFLQTRIPTHQPITITSALLTASTILFTLFTHSTQYTLYAILLFLTGFFCGGYMLAFSICHYLGDPQYRTTIIGFTNTMAMLSAPLLVSFIGFIIQHLHADLPAYQIAMSTIPVLVLISGVIAYFLPNKAPAPPDTHCPSTPTPDVPASIFSSYPKQKRQ